MKITAILIFRVQSPKAQPVLLASSMDLSRFGFFEKKPAKEFITFSCRTVATKTENGVRHCIKEGEYVICAYNKDGLCGLICIDDAYPRPSAFACLRKAMEEYDAYSGGGWRSISEDNKTAVPCVDAILKQGQDPAKVDKLVQVQDKVNETKLAAEKSIRQILDRGETLEDLTQMSDDLSAQTKLFAKQAKDLNKCCTIL